MLALLSPFTVYSRDKILRTQSPVPISVSQVKKLTYFFVTCQPYQHPVKPLSSVLTGSISQNTSASLVTGVATLKYVLSVKDKLPHPLQENIDSAIIALHRFYIWIGDSLQKFCLMSFSTSELTL